MEPDGPLDLSQEIPTAWQSVDQFVIECKKRGLNILMQAPVVGGNGGGLPSGPVVENQTDRHQRT